MKKTRLTLFFLFLVITSCADREAMLALLDQAEQQNRDYVPFTTDSLALVLTDYFDSHGSPNERMRSHYILGCTYRDMGDAPHALQCLNDAAACADTTAADCDFKTLSRVFGQIGELFGNVTAPESELKYYKLAEKAALHAKDTLAAINFLEAQYGAYWMFGHTDSILYVCDIARQMYNEIGKRESAAITRAMAADAFMAKNDYANARKSIHVYEKESGLFDEKGNIRKGYEMYYDIKGRLLYGEGKTDSALTMFNKLLSYRNDITCCEAAYHGLLDVYERKQNADSTAKYSRLLAMINDSSNIVKSSSELVKVQSLYDYSHMKDEVEHKNRTNLIYKAVVTFIIIVFLIATVAAYRYIRAKRRVYRERLDTKRKEHLEALNRFHETEKLLTEARNSMEKNERELKESKQLLSEQNKNKLRTQIDECQRMLNTSIIADFHTLTKRREVPSTEQWKDFHNTFAKCMPTFSLYIDRQEFSLSEREKTTCKLIKLYFDEADIILLMNLTPQKMTNTRASINKKLFGGIGARGIEEGIRNLLIS